MQNANRGVHLLAWWDVWDGVRGQQHGHKHLVLERVDGGAHGGDLGSTSQLSIALKIDILQVI